MNNNNMTITTITPEQIFEIKLPDYSYNFVRNGVKSYYGTIHDIGRYIDHLRNGRCAEIYASTISAFDAFLNGELGAIHMIDGIKYRLLTPVKLVAQADVMQCSAYWTYEIAGVSKTHMRAELLDAFEIIVEDEKHFHRCILPCFEGVEFYHPEGGWISFGSTCFGLHHIAESFPDANAFIFRLYVLEETSESKDDCLFALGYPDHVNLQSSCEEMFGMYDPQDMP